MRRNTLRSKDDALRQAAVFLADLADTLDLWAEESRAGGWSTHQVDANHRQADECRRRASLIGGALTD